MVVSFLSEVSFFLVIVTHVTINKRLGSPLKKSKTSNNFKTAFKYIRHSTCFVNESHTGVRKNITFAKKRYNVINMDCIRGNFENIYKVYYPKMFGFAKTYVLTDEDAENIVQDVFLILWEKKDDIEISHSVTTFLFTLVKNKCLNFLRHRIIQEEYNTYIQEELKFKLYSLELFSYSYQSDEELRHSIRRAIDSLPERCREVFIKSRIEGKKYKEISEELQISVNTVENHIVAALKKMREELKDYLPLLIFLVK